MRVPLAAIAASIMLAVPAGAEDAPKFTPQLLDAVVRLRTQVPADARTAPYLGTEREGSGVLIDSSGLIVTIGYLVTEAMGVEVTPAGGKPVPATIVGFDNESGLGVVRVTEKIDAKPMPLGRAASMAEKTPALVAAFGGIEATQPAVV